MAKATDMTVEDKLRALYDLQKFDSEIDDILRLQGELPMEVKDLEDELEGNRTRIGKITEDIEVLEDNISKHHARIKESENLIIRYTSQQNDVKNNREYDALTKEIELQRLEIKLAEKKIREEKAKIEQKRETQSSVEELIGRREKELTEKKEELRKIIAQTEKDLKAIEKKIAKARKKIEDRLLQAYDKIRKRYRNGMAVVAIERNACGGCYSMIPPQRQLEIRQRKKIIVCEHCSRVLVDQHIEEKSIIEQREEQQAQAEEEN